MHIIRKIISITFRLFVVWIVNGLSLLITDYFYSGITIDGTTFVQKFGVALASTLILGIINLTIRPLFLLFSLPLGLIGVFLIGLLVNAVTINLTARIVPGLEVSSLGGAFWSAIVLAGVNTILTSFITIADRGSFYQSLIGRLARKDSFPNSKTKKQGLAMLEIDGLSYYHIKKAIKEGWMPNLKKMMDKEGYTLSKVDCGIPSMTSSCQAGILFGDNDGIPAFRWYDKKKGKLIVSHIDAAMLNSWYAKGKGLLRNGSSINNMLDGDALKSPLTIATLKKASEKEKKRRAYDIYLLMIHPYFITRTLFLFFVDLGVEITEALTQMATKAEPRLNRFHNGYPLMRAGVTVFCRDVQAALVAMDILRGSPAIYTTYAGYDEVAHHSGPWTKSAMRTLRQFDRVIAQIRTIAIANAPRPYELIILSDHGQSQGWTFKQRYGLSLKEFIQSNMPKGEIVSSTFGGDTGSISVSAMENELGNVGSSGYGGKTGNAFIKPTRKLLNKGVNAQEKDQDTKATEITVCGSGNLAQVYFNFTKSKVTISEINKRYPKLLKALINHEGIGLVICYKDVKTPILYGNKGTVNLRTGRINGTNPLKAYGDTKVRIAQLARLAGFTGNGDMTIISTVYKDGSVAAMEELIGNHGGVGGEQTDAFILHPKAIKVPKTTNSEDVFKILNPRRELLVA